jgi:competence protein ComEC
MTLYSAGENNRYGHPSKETILRMEELNLDYLCTIENGQITIYPKDSGKFLINTYK